MQVFVPYPSPIDVANCLDAKRLHKQILECKQIIAAIGGYGGWLNHPVAKMYKKHFVWLTYYMQTLVAYRIGAMPVAEEYSRQCDILRPQFLTSAFCDQHKRRLYTKAPGLYPQFAPFGTSEENWYSIDGIIVKYKNGKISLEEVIADMRGDVG